MRNAHSIDAMNWLPVDVDHVLKSRIARAKDGLSKIFEAVFFIPPVFFERAYLPQLLETLLQSSEAVDLVKHGYAIHFSRRLAWDWETAAQVEFLEVFDADAARRCCKYHVNHAP